MRKRERQDTTSLTSDRYTTPIGLGILAHTMTLSGLTYSIVAIFVIFDIN